MNTQQLPALHVRNATSADVQRIKSLVNGVLAEFGMSGDPQSADADLEDIEKSYTSSGGLFELIEDREGNLLGTVGLYRLSTEVCELRKMYFVPEVRGQGLGKKVLERTVEAAKRLGFKRIELETASVLKQAQRLYLRFGFKPMPDKKLSCRSDQAYFLDLESPAA